MLDLREAQQHIPVLLDEVLVGLDVLPGGCYLDATVGGGGHAEAILKAAAPDGRLLALDRDPVAASYARERLADWGERVTVVHASYVHLDVVARERGFVPLDGVLFDLGFSSWQIDDAARGFSFREAGPLDMRFDPTEEIPTADYFVNEVSESELAGIIRQHGEEPRSRRVARAIVAARPIRDTKALADVIADAVGGTRRSRIHPATRTFQALRIAVNHELRGVEDVLPLALDLLRPGGRLAVITFHSLEDRIVKHFMRYEARDCVCPPELPVCRCGHTARLRDMTRKPLTPSVEEVRANPRSRSAKLRIGEKIT